MPLGGYCMFDDPKKVKDAGMTYDSSVDSLSTVKKSYCISFWSIDEHLSRILISLCVYASVGSYKITGTVDCFLPTSQA